MKKQFDSSSEQSAMLFDEECEAVVLSFLLGGRLEEVREILSLECFYIERHQSIFQAVLNVSDRGEEVNIISVMPELKRMKAEVSPYDLTAISGKAHGFNAYQYAARLHDLEKRRRFWRIGQYLVSSGTNEDEDIVDVLAKVEEELKLIFCDTSVSVTTLYNSIKGLYDIVNRNLQADEPMTGTPTGFPKIDNKGGLQPSDLVIVAGSTSQGKTSFATSVILTAIKAGSKVAFYSMEMTRQQLTARLASVESGIPANELLYSRLDKEKISMLDKGIGKLYDDCGKGLFFDDRSTSSIDMIIASIRSMKIKYEINGAVVDYLQILNVNMKGTNKEQQMGEVARRLKNLAKELNIWIIALSQLNRDSQNPEPSTDRLRDSGQIAEAADTVILIYRPEVYGKPYPKPFHECSTKGTAMINISKGRNIGTGRFICGFDSNTAHFYNLEDVPLVSDSSAKSNNDPW